MAINGNADYSVIITDDTEAELQAEIDAEFAEAENELENELKGGDT